MYYAITLEIISQNVSIAALIGQSKQIEWLKYQSVFVPVKVYQYCVKVMSHDASCYKSITWNQDKYRVYQKRPDAFEFKIAA